MYIIGSRKLDIGCLSMSKGKEEQEYCLDVDIDCKTQDFDANKQQKLGTVWGWEELGSKDGETDGEDDDEYSSSDDASSSADNEYGHSQDDDRGDSDDSADDEPPTPV